MWLSRTAFTLCFVLLVSSCGFKPLYTTGATPAARAFDTIAVSNIPDREGQYLRNMLLDKLYSGGIPAEPRYVLNVRAVRKTVTSFGIKRSATSTRGQIDLSTDIRLIDRQTGKAVLERSLSAAGDYNRLDNQYATVVSEESVTNNLLGELSDSIMTELALHFAREGQSP